MVHRTTPDSTTVAARRPNRRAWRRSAAGLAAVTACGALIAPTAGAASASGTKTSPFATFANCPTDNKKVTACIVATITGGTFALGGISAAITKPIKIQLGLENVGGPNLVGIPPDNGTPALKSPVIYLPGGIPGLAGIPGFPSSGNALDAGFLPFVDGTIAINIANMLSGAAPAFALPIGADVVNQLISSSCNIAPINVNITDGTTKPPAGVTPLTGSLGKLKLESNGIISITGLKLVDNTFAVPATQSCNLLNLVPIDIALDAVVGLPAAPGKSTAILTGNAELVPAVDVVKAGY